MIIKLTGASGYLGNLISAQLHKQGHTMQQIPRELLYGDTAKLSGFMRDASVIINLAGAPILARWTNSRRKKIYDSRVKTTGNLVKAIHMLSPEIRPRKFISISATGIYQAGKIHDENSHDFATDFV